MEADLEKLVESGKLSAKAAEQLEKLKPGTFCLHKSWGFGRVTEWNLLLNQIVIDFAGKKSHPMQVQYAAENLTPLALDHFLARKASDLLSIKKLAREDPVALVRNILHSLGGQATVSQISEWLVDDIFSEAEWKRWWESTKRLLKVSGGFSIPAKKTEPIQLRREGVSHTDELVAAFNKARQPKEQIAALEQIIKFHQQFKDPEKQLQSIVAPIENVAARNQKMHPELAFELIIARDDLLERVSQLHTTHIGLTLSKLILDEEKRLMSILPKLPAAKEKRVLQALPTVLGPRWTERALQLMQGSHGRMIAQIARVFGDAGINAIYATQYKRTQETVKPLSDKTGVPVTIVNSKGTAELLVQIRAQHSGQTIFIAGHNNTVPEIIEALGGPKYPIIPETEYDNLYVVTVYRTGKAKVVKMKYGSPGQ